MTKDTFKKKVFIVKCPRQANAVLRFLENRLDETPDRDYQVTINYHEPSRSKTQNRLLWKWMGVIADEMGEDKNAAALEFKVAFAVPILRAHSPEFNDIAFEIGLMGTHTKQMKMWNEVKVTSRRDFGVKLMRDYLAMLERHAAENDIILPRRDDEYYESMGLQRS